MAHEQQHETGYKPSYYLVEEFVQWLEDIGYPKPDQTFYLVFHEFCNENDLLPQQIAELETMLHDKFYIESMEMK